MDSLILLIAKQNGSCCAVYLLQIHHKMEAAAQAGNDVTSLEDDAFNVEAAQDKCILRLIASCCNSKHLF